MSKILNFKSGANQVQGKKTMEVQGFLAEFYVNDRSDPPVYHYVVMPKGSVEIVGWGQEHTAESAERMARNCMEMLGRSKSTAV